MVFFGLLFGIPAFLWFIWKYGMDGERLPEQEPDLIVWDERDSPD